MDVRKKKFKIVWEMFQHRAGSICSKLDSTLEAMVVVFLNVHFSKSINVVSLVFKHEFYSVLLEVTFFLSSSSSPYPKEFLIVEEKALFDV